MSQNEHVFPQNGPALWKLKIALVKWKQSRDEPVKIINILH